MTTYEKIKIERDNILYDGIIYDALTRTGYLLKNGEPIMREKNREMVGKKL